MKKIIIATVGIIIIVAIILSSKTTSAGGLVNSADFMSKLQSSPNAVLLDVRTPAEFNVSHIENAVNVDYENINFDSEVKKLDQTKEYFIYCRSGNRSSKALPIMKASGIKVIYELQGGINAAPELLK